MFLYFIPEKSDAEEKLAYAFEGPPVRSGCLHGPNDGPGKILAQNNAQAGVVGYYPDRQTWRKIPGVDAWIGRQTGQEILPEHLARAKQLQGTWVELADGQRWLIPLARGWTEEDGELRWYQVLPRKSRLDDEGTWQAGEVLAQFAELWQWAQAWELQRLDVRIDDNGDRPPTATWDFAGLMEAAVVALAANYRLSGIEASELGLLSDKAAIDALDGLIDFSTRMEWLKKKFRTDPDGVNTSAGGGA